MLVQPRTLSGFKDRLPKEAIAKNNLINKITSVFDSFGFVPIETPHLEYAEVLIKQGSEEIQKELYAFKDHGGRDVALRFDLTVPLARFISQHRYEVGIPFKRYAIGNVFRGERAQKGRYREFTQCDVDFIGSKSIASDSEIIQVIASVMKNLEVGDFTISINHRGVLNGICEYLGIKDVCGALRIVDKLDKIGVEGVKRELEEIGVSNALELLEFVGHNGRGEEFLSSVACFKNYNDTLKSAINELEELEKILRALNLKCVKFNFSIARGLGYYTGIVYETTLDSLPSIGSVCSGGRYDHLTQTFSKEDLSGAGASVGLDRLLCALEELGKLEIQSTRAKVLCACMDMELMPYTQKFASNLRESARVGVEVYPDIIKLAKQFSYADTKGHCYVAVIGEDEAKEGKITLKDMRNAKQYKMISWQECIEICKEG